MEPKDEKEVKEIGEQVLETCKDLNATIAKQDEEIKLLGAAKEATEKSVADMMVKYDAIISEFKEKVERSDKRCSDLEAEASAPAEPAGGDSEFKTIGQRFVESEEFKALFSDETMQHIAHLKSEPVAIGSFAREIHQKSVVRLAKEMKVISSAAASAGDLQQPFQDTEIYKRPDRMPTLRDLQMAGPISQSSVDYWLRTGFFPLSTTISTTEAIGQTVLSVTSTDGFYAGQTVLIGAGTRVVGSVQPDDGTITVTVALAAEAVAGTRVSSQLFAPQTELAGKPQSDLTWDEQSRVVRTIASWIRSSRQILQDVPGLQAEIENDLMYMQLLTEEWQILYGDNAGTNLQGITTAAGIQTLAWSAGEPGDTRMDTIARGAGLCSAIEYPTTAVVVNPLDRIRMTLEKAADGHYLYPNGLEAFLGFPVISTSAILAGRALVGAFGFAGKLRDRQESQIRTSDNYNDDFVRNATVVLAEERLVQYIPLPEGYCYLTLDAAPAA